MPRIVTLFLAVGAVLAIAVAAGCIAQPTVAVEGVRVGRGSGGSVGSPAPPGVSPGVTGGRRRRPA